MNFLNNCLLTIYLKNQRFFFVSIVGIIFTLSMTSCMHSIHLVHVSDFEPYGSFESGDIVKAKSEQFTILGFTDNTNYVDQAYRKIQEECPKGRLQGLTTQFSTSLGFFSWTNKILIQGLCVKS